MTHALRNKYFHSVVVSCTGYEAISELSKKILDDKVRYSLGELYYVAGDYDAAFYKWKQLTDSKFVNWSNIHKSNYFLQQKNFDSAKEILLSIESKDINLNTDKYWNLSQVYKQRNNEYSLVEAYRELIELDLNYKNIYEEITTYFNNKLLYTDLYRTEMFGPKIYSEQQQSRVLKCLEFDNTGQLSLKNYFELFIVKLINQGSSNIDSSIKNIQKYLIKHGKYEKGVMVFAEAIKNNPDSIGSFFIGNNLKVVIDLLDGLYWHGTSLKEVSSVFKYVESCLENLLLTDYQRKIISSYTGKVINLTFKLKAKPNQFKDVILKVYELSEKYELKKPIYSKNMLDYLISNNKKILITGRFNAGKSSFINSILEEEILKSDVIPTTSAITVLSNDDKTSLAEWKGNKLGASRIDNLEEVTTINHEKSSSLSTSMIFFKTPNKVLKELNICFIDTPGFFDDQGNTDNNPTFDYLDLADEILFMFAAEEAFSNNEKNIIEKIKTTVPNTPISFVINKVDMLEEEEIDELREDVERKLYKTFGKKSPLYLYSSEETEEYYQSLIEGIKAKKNHIRDNQFEKMPEHLKAFAEEMSKVVEDRHLNHIKLLKETNLEMKQYKDYVIKIKECCGNFVKESVQTLNTELFEPLQNVYNKIVLDYIRYISNTISYEEKITVQIDLINEKLNSFAKDKIEIFIGSDLVKESVLNWGNSLIPKIQKHIDQLQQQLEPNLNVHQYIKKPNYKIEKLLGEQLLAVKQLKIEPIDFINKDEYIKNFLSNVGRIFGVNSTQKYDDLEKLKRYLKESSFDSVLSHYTQHLFQIINALAQEQYKVLTFMTKELNDYLESNLKTLEISTNNAALAYKKFSQIKASELIKWELVSMKAEQLKILFQEN